MFFSLYIIFLFLWCFEFSRSSKIVTLELKNELVGPHQSTWFFYISFSILNILSPTKFENGAVSGSISKKSITVFMTVETGFSVHKYWKMLVIMPHLPLLQAVSSDAYRRTTYWIWSSTRLSVYYSYIYCHSSTLGLHH
jgi:hypothetical protein